MIPHTFSLSSPAKINWSLQIGKMQENGLHEICTEMEKISLADTVEIEMLSQGKEGEILFSLENPNQFPVPQDETNLAVRAALSFFNTRDFPALSLRLTKQIPSGAGLGGGSSNAATVLKALFQIFPERRTQKELFAIAKELGSDVPFFLGNSSRTLVEGTGEKLTPLFGHSDGFLTLCLPKNISIATAWAYFEWEKTKPKTTNGNDFEPIVFSAFPELAYRKEVLKNLGAEKVALSGSGGTVFGVFSEKEKAEKGKEVCENLGDWTAVCPFAE